MSTIDSYPGISAQTTQETGTQELISIDVVSKESAPTLEEPKVAEKLLEKTSKESAPVTEETKVVEKPLEKAFLDDEQVNEPFLKLVKVKTQNWFLASLDVIWFIIWITIIYLLILVTDTLILAVIIWSFGSTISQIPIATGILDGIKLFSAFGTAIAYALHLIYSLYREARHVAKLIRKTNNEKE